MIVNYMTNDWRVLSKPSVGAVDDSDSQSSSRSEDLDCFGLMELSKLL